jgi:UDP-N-acetylmuramoyl-tripeptide--D-alanyl-D-alanine ligase
MKELGSKSAEYHAGLKAHLEDAGVTYALLVGEEMAPLAEALAADVVWKANFTHCPTARDAIPLVQEIIRPGDAILIKGSNSMGLSTIVDALAGDLESRED